MVLADGGSRRSRFFHKSVFICYNKHSEENNADRIAQFQKRFKKENVIAYDSPEQIDDILTPRRKPSHFIIKNTGIAIASSARSLKI